MTISTKAELKTEASAWVDDPAWFDARVDSLIVLAEARLNRALKGRQAVVETELTGTADSRTIALPDAYSEPLGLWLTTDGDRKPVQAYIPSALPYNSSSGEPRGWAVIGSNITFDRACDQAHTFAFLHREKFSLAEDSGTNWLLTDWPDAYLAALMVEVYAFKVDANAAVTWNERLKSAIDEITTLDAQADRLAPLNVDPALASHGRGYSYNDLVRGG